MPFLQGLLDVFPFTSDDLEARSALWNIVARLLVRVRETEMSSSALQQYVSVLVSKSDVIEEDLLDCQLGGLGLKARTTAVSYSVNLLFNLQLKCIIVAKSLIPAIFKVNSVSHLKSCLAISSFFLYICYSSEGSSVF